MTIPNRRPRSLNGNHEAAASIERAKAAGLIGPARGDAPGEEEEFVGSFEQRERDYRAAPPKLADRDTPFRVK